MPILDIGRVAPDQPGRRWVVRAEQLLASGDVEAALAVCDDGLQSLPDDPGCLLMRARVLHRLHRLEEAMTALWKVVALDSSRPEARRGLAELLTGTSSPTPSSAPGPQPHPSRLSDHARPVSLEGRTDDVVSPTVPWNDDIFDDLEQRLRAREAMTSPSADEVAALADLERWLEHLTGADS